MSDERPPIAKYRLTLTIDANSHDEIVNELLSMTRGGYLLDSDYYKRDEFKVVGGRRMSVLEHTNPDMTPEQYEADLDAWWRARMAARPASGAVSPLLLVAAWVALWVGGCVWAVMGR